MTIHDRIALLALISIAFGGCSSEQPPVLGCEPADGLTPDCRFTNPEDIVVSPSGRFLLVSQMGTPENLVGSLVAVDPVAGTIEALFPRRDMPAGADSSSRSGGSGHSPNRGQESAPTPGPAADGAAAWGDPDCTPAATFSPHGIDIETLDDGRQALYAVNHGGRESVEMFEVHDAGRVSLTWRGCVLAPDDGYFNDLVVLRNGGFWVSQMYPREANVLWTVLRMQLFGYEPGYVYHWRPGQGFRTLPGTETAFANGVEKSEDERYLYLNGYFSDVVEKIDVASGELLGSAEVASPDNLSWSPTGELLAASHVAGLTDVLACQDLTQGSCGFRYQIVAIDPDTMTPRVLLEHAGPPMGAATVARPYRDAVYLGTFAGDRITRAPASILAKPES